MWPGAEAQATLQGKIFQGFLFNVDWPRNVTFQRIPWPPKAVPSCSTVGGGWGEGRSLAALGALSTHEIKSDSTAQRQLRGPEPSSTVLS